MCYQKSSRRQKWVSINVARRSTTRPNFGLLHLILDVTDISTCRLRNYYLRGTSCDVTSHLTSDPCLTYYFFCAMLFACANWFRKAVSFCSYCSPFCILATIGWFSLLPWPNAFPCFCWLLSIFAFSVGFLAFLSLLFSSSEFLFLITLLLGKREEPKQYWWGKAQDGEAFRTTVQTEEHSLISRDHLISLTLCFILSLPLFFFLFFFSFPLLSIFYMTGWLCVLKSGLSNVVTNIDHI